MKKYEIDFSLKNLFDSNEENDIEFIVYDIYGIRHVINESTYKGDTYKVATWSKIEESLGVKILTAFLSYKDMYRVILNTTYSLRKQYPLAMYNIEKFIKKYFY